ncbi:uncharacterized protein LOC130612118 [Hydractinia symbiolongicarpus]|uniref:uncharacterized protein LOC130612118 n=1 Tax=Hydractinia symbiolongicarpus TaxID=13093 RepID=UPI002551BD6F|nr:uncharacterized protein LOC130612118 [Hydractinia symbiolongicarpus]
MKLIRVVLMLLSLLGIVFLIISTAGTAWGKDDSQTNFNEAVTDIGLWKSCRGEVCTAYLEEVIEGWWFAIRVEMILAIIISFTGFILSMVMIVRESVKGYYLAGLLAPAAFLAFIGVCTWMSKINKPYKIGYSCVLGVVGVVILVTAIIAAIISTWRMKKQQNSSSAALMY